MPGQPGWNRSSNLAGSTPPNVCAYMVRAKRLNINPINVELVWFDDKELTNPTYALYVAAQGGNDPALVPKSGRFAFSGLHH